ncbi:MAG: response regulator, partial [Acidothermaceae bacterium]
RSAAAGDDVTALRVVIADDHPVFRDGLRALLHDLGADVVAEAADGAAALNMVERHRPDVVLMDLRMPVLNGIEAVGRLSRDHPHVAVLVLTMSEDTPSLQAALAAGARGYLLKESTKEDIGRALDAVARGEIVIGSGIAARVRAAVSGPRTGSAFPQLTDREHEVLSLLAKGLDNSSIARRLFLAEKTVRNRVSVVMTKLDVSTRAAAIAKARDAGIGTEST